MSKRRSRAANEADVIPSQRRGIFGHSGKRRSRAANEADVTGGTAEVEIPRRVAPRHDSNYGVPSERRGISASRDAKTPGRFPVRNDKSVALCALLLTTVSTVHAQGQTPEGPSLLPLVLTFVLVLALIPVAVWMLKRLGAGNVATTAGMQVVAQLPLGPRERLVVVEAGDRWLILGVTPSAINRVGTLPKGELPAGGGAGGTFASLLMHARRGRDNA